MTTPICSRLNERLRDRDSYFRSWLFLWHHIGREDPIEIDMFNGKTASFNMTGFGGTARTLYWEAIVRGLRKEVVEQFRAVEIEARSYALGTAIQSIDECAGALISFVGTIRRAAVEKHALLCSNGDGDRLDGDAGHWEDLSDTAILRQAEAIKSGLKDLAGLARPTEASDPAPKLTSIEVGRRQMLFALIIAHETRSSSFQDLKVLNEAYNIRMPASLVASSISPWVDLGWVKRNATLDGKVAALLSREHYGDALQFIMEWLGATSLTVDVQKKEIVADVSPTQQVCLPDRWSWFTFSDAGSNAYVPGSDRLVPLNHNDPELEAITESLAHAIEAVRGDNGLERREDVLSSLKFVQAMLGRAELGLLQLRVGVPMILEEATQLAAGWGKVAVIEAVKAAVVDWVRRTFGF